MEGFSFAAPRLARDYYANDGWALQQTRPNGGDHPRTLSEASDPVKGQANTNNLADNGDLHLAGNEASATTASDPIKEGQAKTNDPAANEDLQPFNNKKASDPEKEGQAKTNDIADNEELQAISLKGKISAVNEDLHHSLAQCGIFQEEASHHLAQASASNLVAQAHVVASASKQQAAPFNLTPAASVFIPLSIAAHTKASPSAFTPSTLANPAPSPSHQHRLHSAIRASSLQVFSPLASNASAIPVLKPNHSATSTHSSTSTIPVILSSTSTAMLAISTIPALPTASPSSQWRDEVMTTSSATIYSILPGGFSRLRAMASPWTPIKPTLPSLLVGDIPITPVLPLTSTPKTPPLADGFLSPCNFCGQSSQLTPSCGSTSTSTTHKSPLTNTLLLPGARQSLASPHPVETLGVKQQSNCPFCGHILHLQAGSTSLMEFGFFPLRGRNGVEQAQESKAIMHHHGVDPARQSTRPRFKMKSELKGFRVHKATLDPG